MIAWLVPLAFAHGGVDDEPAAKTTTAPTTDKLSVALSSHSFDAVLRFDRGPAKTAVSTSLLLADATTSAPIADATASVSLAGPDTVQIDYVPGSAPGIYAATTTFPASGDYAGALVVTTPNTSDLLALSALPVPAPPSGGGVAPGWAVAGVAGALVVAGIAGAMGFGGGFLLGRRRGGAAAGCIALGLSAAAAHRVEAHGGVDDEGGGATTAATGPVGALVLPMESQFLLGLRTERLAPEPFADQVEALGRFVSRPGESATLRAPVSGIVVAPGGGFLPPGREVHAGDVLATIREDVGSADRTSVAQGRAAAITELAEARKALALSERDASRIPDLAEALSGRERLEREQSLVAARARVSAAEAAVAETGSGANVTIRAPVSGRLGPTTARPGDQVEAGDPLFRVIDPAGLWVEARLPERLALGVTEGAGATVLSAADPGHSRRAVVLDAGQEADPATGTVLVTLAVEGEAGGLRAGMGATAWIAGAPSRDALVVPDTAVVDSNGSTLAFVKTGPESFEMRELRLGGRAAETWEVLAGLGPHERVVTVGTYALRSLAGR